MQHPALPMIRFAPRSDRIRMMLHIQKSKSNHRNTASITPSAHSLYPTLDISSIESINHPKVVEFDNKGNLVNLFVEPACTWSGTEGRPRSLDNRRERAEGD